MQLIFFLTPVTAGFQCSQEGVENLQMKVCEILAGLVAVIQPRAFKSSLGFSGLARCLFLAPLT